jgi:hypothetical protein
MNEIVDRGEEGARLLSCTNLCLLNCESTTTYCGRFAGFRASSVLLSLLAAMAASALSQGNVLWRLVGERRGISCCSLDSSVGFR